jgi:outer membrane protein
VAAETVGARQLLSDQVTELAKNNLRSQLDVSFADVNVSEAKLRMQVVSA